MDEKVLIEAAQKNPERFAELYENNFERIYAYVSSRLRDRNESEDLTSQVFHHALANLSRYKWQGVPFSAWLYRIAGNLIADHFERLSREGKLTEAANHPEVSNQEIETRASVFRFVRNLPADQQRVVMARFSEQKSIAAIAKELGRSEGAVKQLQFRALKSLREKMRKHNG